MGTVGGNRKEKGRGGRIFKININLCSVYFRVVLMNEKKVKDFFLTQHPALNEFRCFIAEC